MSLNSVQSFVIENCNGPTIENGLNNVCLHPLSRTFTFCCICNNHYIIPKSFKSFAMLVPMQMNEVLFQDPTNSKEHSFFLIGQLLCRFELLLH